MDKPNAFDDYVNNLCEELVMKVNETEEEFIFATISPFVDGIAERHIPKKDLIGAILFLQIREKYLGLYGIEIGLDWNTATKQLQELEKAYLRGYDDGIRHARERVDILDKTSTTVSDILSGIPYFDNYDDFNLESDFIIKTKED